MIRKCVLVAFACALIGSAGTLASADMRARSVYDPIATISPERRSEEHVFLRTVKRNETANSMTSDVLAHVGERVAYICEVEELTRPGVVVGQCGTAGENVDVYVKLTGTWRAGDKFRVLGVLETPASWSDIGGHTIYYPFIKAVFADRLH